MEQLAQNIRISDYTYNLPDSRIAKYPLEQRDQSKLLVFNSSGIHEELFRDLPRLLPPLSLLVRNNTKVIQARVEFLKESGARIEIFCLEPALPADYESNLSSKNKVTWFCLIGNAKKWKSGQLHKELILDGRNLSLVAERLDPIDGKERIRFSWNPGTYSFSELLEVFGTTPLPPYLQRDAEPEDKSRYQTLYAQSNGSVAAPTAGLHFTNNMNSDLKLAQVKISELTLHVGAGTFTPVKSETIGQHQMHTEHIRISRDLLHDLMNHFPFGITAVGTTSMRTLESIYWLGVLLKGGQLNLEAPLHIDQWIPYQSLPQLPTREAILEVLTQMMHREMENLEFTTSLFIIPGYTFRIVNRLVTNFHQPGSTLLLLVAAFIGEDWKGVYQHALQNNFRFLSYGDSSLLERVENTKLTQDE